MKTVVVGESGEDGGSRTIDEFLHGAPAAFCRGEGRDYGPPSMGLPVYLELTDR